MLQLALTGNIASGKSTVAEMLAARGATIVDSDKLAREAVAAGTEGLEAVVERFGSSVLLPLAAPNGAPGESNEQSPDRQLDRAALRKLVFADPIARDALNAIVHPIVARLREAEVSAARKRGDKLVISDIPLLFEVGLEYAFDGVILVDAPEQVRVDRLVATRGLSREDALAMSRSQMPAQRKRAKSRWIIENNGSIQSLEAQVEALWQELQKLPRRGPLPLSRLTEDTTS